MRLKIFQISTKVLKEKIVLLSRATDAGHATEGAVEEDLADNDSTKDPIFMPGRYRL